MSDDHKEELRIFVSHLGAGIRESHYRPAFDAAANVRSGIFDTITTSYPRRSWTDTQPR
ncbi:hypothetical protein OG613_17495 [Streptomyces sp. NBC_00015]|uniref:hypothetical protein n=1 Tax=Streptomyces sp. NBC_00015 TaxID=2903611 RepID=UPI003247113D